MAQYDKTIHAKYKADQEKKRKENSATFKRNVKTTVNKTIDNVVYDVKDATKAIKDFGNKTAKNTIFQIEKSKEYRSYRRTFDKTKIGTVDVKFIDGVRYAIAYTEHGPILQTSKPSSTLKKASVNKHSKTTLHPVPAVDCEVSIDTTYEGMFPHKETGKLFYANLNARYFSGPNTYYPHNTPCTYECSTLTGTLKKGALFEEVKLLDDEFRYPLFHDQDDAVYAFRYLEQKFQESVKEAGIDNLETQKIEQRVLSPEELEQIHADDEIYYYATFGRL